MSGGGIPQRFRKVAGERPGQIVVDMGVEQTTFSELDAASDRVAGGLALLGVARGDRVGLYCINGREFVEAYLGILKAGAVVVPINLLIAPQEVRFIVADAGVRVMIYHEAMAAGWHEARASGCDDLLASVCIGEAGRQHDDALFSELLDTDQAAPDCVVDPAEDLAAILYTSGTTGRPKGAMLTHANLLSNTSSVQRALDLRPGEDVLLVVLPMFHAFAATVGMLTPLLHGLTMAPVVRFEPGPVSQAVAATGATVFLGVPSMYAVLHRLPDERLQDWRQVRFGVSGGAAMPVDLMQRFEARFGLPILEGDGPTECSPVTCVNPVAGIRKPGSVGLPVPDVEMEILDDAGTILPAETIGEICVRGPNVMKGYWRLPEATAETFADTWLRTGDLGYKDNDGYIFMVDRKKDLIIVNGMNVYPRMVEEVLYGCDGVVEAAVVGEPHPSHGEIVVAYVVLEADSGLTPAALKQHCREQLGQHQRPRKIHLRDELPKNATGKILKRELRRAGEIERGVTTDAD